MESGLRFGLAVGDLVAGEPPLYEVFSAIAD
jgi:hypothetical protein